MRPLHINNKLVSVIVPMYNAETTICRCVDSILSQTYRNIEVILIDDGSKDATLSIAEDYTQRDIRVKAYAKKNGGVSSARNFGLENASGGGDYIY